MTIVANNFDDIFGTLIRSFEDPQFVSSPRGQKIKENLVQTVILKNPRARLLSFKARDANYGFAVGEFLWYWTGKTDLETMLYYNKRMKDFSDDGVTINSAYGHRIFTPIETHGVCLSQWEICIRSLLKDNDSRRAVLLINSPLDELFAESMGSKDVPCTLSLQFFIRNNRLDLHVVMRSNDAFWGLTYDLFSFTLLQEAMMLELREHGLKDLQLGTYYHTAGSMHIYERHFDLAAQLSEEYLSPEFAPRHEVGELDLNQLERLVPLEEKLRNKKVDQIDIEAEGFSGTVKWMAEELNKHRSKRDEERKTK